MKNCFFLVIVSAIVFVSFIPHKGVVGNAFPSMKCEDYNGKTLVIPTETMGKYTLLGMAFSNDAESDLTTWLNPIYNKFIAKKDNSDPFAVNYDYDINLYVIPMFTGTNQLTSKSSKEKIRAHTEKELYPHLLFYEGSKTYKEELDFEKKGVPYFFILDKKGKIVYATSGKYDDEKLEKIIDIIEEN